jgi:hypothetical protein
LAGDDVAQAVRALSALATVKPQSPLMTDEHRAWVCYGHLGGTLGNALLAALLDRKLLEPHSPSSGTIYDYQVTAQGAEVMRGFGIDVTGLRKRRRYFARLCRNTYPVNAHLSGSLAKALLEGLLERRWSSRTAAETDR